MSFAETIFLFVLALLVFGPKKLPEIARQVGRALNEFRRASNEFKAQIEQEIAHLETKPEILPPNPSPTGTLNRTGASDAPASQSEPAMAATDPPALMPATELPTAEAPGLQTSSAATHTSDQSATSDVPPQAPAASDPVTAPASQESHA